MSTPPPIWEDAEWSGAWAVVSDFATQELLPFMRRDSIKVLELLVAFISQWAVFQNGLPVKWLLEVVEIHALDAERRRRERQGT